MQQQAELFASKAAQHVAAANVAAALVGHLLQPQVAGRVPVGIVDALEIIHTSRQPKSSSVVRQVV
jgi:hypothetical protein